MDVVRRTLRAEAGLILRHSVQHQGLVTACRVETAAARAGLGEHRISSSPVP